MRKAVVFICLAGVIGLTACVRVRQVPGGIIQTGIASWYGSDFQGKRTSNKEIYDMYDMTAAHQTLPFGTQVMVTNLDNGQTAVVRINDRGPFVKGRIIDLSYAAARVLGIIGQGTARVRLEVLGKAAFQPSAQVFSVQVGSFISRENAENLKRRLENKYEGVYISLYRTPGRTYYRVRLRAGDRASADRTAQRLADDGLTVLILEEQ